jgi:hypothetical protein
MKDGICWTMTVQVTRVVGGIASPGPVTMSYSVFEPVEGAAETAGAQKKRLAKMKKAMRRLLAEKGWI